MVVSIHLDDEEKFQVLLVALALFLFALIVSLCLALSCCPLNKWLLERSLKRKLNRRQQSLAARSFVPTSSQLHRNIVRHGHSSFRGAGHWKSGATLVGQPHPSYIGPPPAYEAALRATRLQSLTSTCLAPAVEPAKSSPDWLKSALATSNNNSSDHFNYDTQLDLGDYFHQPREFQPLQGADDTGFAISGQQAGAATRPNDGRAPRPPVMLRLWVKLMEPGELVQRARAQTETNRRRQTATQQLQGQETGLRRLSLTRQLSIPHLFGSLMTTLASSKSSAAICGDGGTQARANEPEGVAKEAVLAGEEAAAREQQLSSLSSDTTNSSSAGNLSAEPQEDEREERVKHDQQISEPTSGMAAHTTIRLATGDLEPTGQLNKRPLEQTASGGRAASSKRRHSIPPIASSITSRVLHMNVASFSYVKDEELISTKKHNQLNFHHFYAPSYKTTGVASNTTTSTTSTTSSTNTEAAAAPRKPSKMCQLLVSICDIENLLNSSCMESRACLRLAQNSSIYVKCEILAPNSTNLGHTASRLLRNPLKVLTHQQSSTSSLSGQQHATVDFGATIPATAMEPTPSLQLQETERLSKQAATTTTTTTFGEQQAASSASTQRQVEQLEKQDSAESLACVNWRHEPSAIGKSIVVFNSIPKQLAQQQQHLASTTSPGSGQFSSYNSQLHQQHQLDDSLRSSSTGSGPAIDLIQFDSVFVSPILAKSTLEGGHIRLRVYSQCKYVNETCLAELKLPLKQLMRAQTRDNLGDAQLGPAAPAMSQQQQQQADFILNNLLANLVTASTGSPLSTLIEQISAEAREEDGEEEGRHRPTTDSASGANFLSSWLATSGAGPTADQPNAGVNLQRASASLGAALNYLGGSSASAGERQAAPTLTSESSELAGWQGECAKLIEQNYCRSLMVSHWLNYLVAPSYECQRVAEQRGQLLLGLTYLPTSNRLIFNAHRATIDQENCPAADKQLIKKLRLQSDTSYHLHFLMLANGRVLRRKQTASGRQPHWDSQEAVTFDLANVQVDRPSFVVCLVMRNSHALATGSLQSLTDYYHSSRNTAAAHLMRPPASASAAAAAAATTVQSDPESLRYAAAATPTIGPLEASRSSNKRDLVIGHLVLADDVWHELRSQPRKQIIKQFALL